MSNPSPTKAVQLSKLTSSRAGKVFQRLGRWAMNHQESLAVLLILLLNLILVSPTLMPEFAWINPYDEAKYVDSGWRLLQGSVRDLAWGPVVALVYAPLHLLVGNSPDWFLLEDWLGRFTLFTGLWLSTYYLTRQFKQHIHPLLVPGLLLVSQPFFPLLENQADAVFVCFSILALVNVIKYYQELRNRNIWIASLFVGLGILARFETILWVGVLLFLTLWIGRHQPKSYKRVIAALVPVLSVLFFYSIALYISTGSLNFGLAEKSYEAFELNQNILVEGANIPEIQAEARRLYGTAEENNHSVITAILRNPLNFGLRMLTNGKIIPETFLDFWGKKFGPLILIFSLLGAFYLLRKKTYYPLLLPVIWAAPALVALGFFIRHLITQTVYLPFLFAAIGIQWTADARRSKGRIWVILGVFLLFTLASLITAKPAFLVGGVLISGALLLFILLGNDGPDASYLSGVVLLLMLVVGLILHGNYPFPNFPSVGVSREEQAVHFLQQEYETGSVLLVPSAAPAVASMMAYFIIDNVEAEISTPDQLWEWMRARNIQAAYISDEFNTIRDLDGMLEEGIGSYFTRGFVSADSDIKIYQVIH